MKKVIEIYRGWELMHDYCGIVAIQPQMFDESGVWQINATDIEDAKCQIDEHELAMAEV